MFADDLKLVENNSENQLQEDLNKLYQWTLDCGLPLNVDKCYQLVLRGADSNSRSFGDKDRLIISTQR